MARLPRLVPAVSGEGRRDDVLENYYKPGPSEKQTENAEGVSRRKDPDPKARKTSEENNFTQKTSENGKTIECSGDAKISDPRLRLGMKLRHYRPHVQTP